VRLLLALTRKYVALREDQRYYWQKSLAVTRRAFLMLAERLVRDGVIAAREDLFYATWEEIEKHFAGQNPDLAARIAQRRAEWQEYARQAHYPAFLRGDTPVEPVESAWTREWRGRAVSPGNAQGHARVVRSPGDFNRIRAGDILIAPATDPAWTPIFARLAGLVLERGGVLSHGAVVAREYGLPAVAGIPNITDVLHDDEMIQVDGSVGVVRKI
jgi:pyruvate,water dikinase